MDISWSRSVRHSRSRRPALAALVALRLVILDSLGPPVIVIAIGLAVGINRLGAGLDDLCGIVTKAFLLDEILGDLAVARLIARGKRVSLAVQVQIPSSGSIGRSAAWS